METPDNLRWVSIVGPGALCQSSKIKHGLRFARVTTLVWVAAGGHILTTVRAIAAKGAADSADVLFCVVVANLSILAAFCARVWRFCAAAALRGRSSIAQVVLGTMLLWLASGGVAAAAGCNWPVTFSSIGQTKTQSLVACDYLFSGQYGGVFDSLGVQSAFEFGIGTDHTGPGNPVTEQRTGVNGGKYNFRFDTWTGVMTIELVTAPSSSPDTLTVYSYMDAGDPNLTTNTTNTFTFTYAPPPTVSAVSPTEGPSAGGTTVTVTGANFTGATAVNFGATSATFTVVNATTITATAPAGVGVVDVTVTTPNGTSATGPADRFTYLSPPSVTGLSPAAGPTGGGTSVVLTGTNFTGATAVTFGGTAASSFTVDSATQITATAPAGAAGGVNVRVTGPGGTSTIGGGNLYTYVNPPTIAAIAPSGGPTSGSTSVVITGTNLVGASSVHFGSTAASSFTVDSATQITAVSPASSAGTVDIIVTSVGGTSATSAADQYTFVPPPAVTSVTVPANGSYSAGQVLGFTVNFDRSITVVGTDSALGLTIGSAARGATYVSNTTTSILYQYTVQSGDVDADGITIGSISLGASTVSDSYGSNANLTLNSVGSTAGVLVDAVAPQVSSITVLAPVSVRDKSVTFQVDFSETVTAVGLGAFSLTKTGSADGTLSALVSPSGARANVTVSGISGIGSLRLDLSAPAGITDAAGNGLSAYAGAVHTVDMRPGAPVIGTATPGDGVVSVAFSAPVDHDGVEALTYTVTSSPDGIVKTGAASPIAVDGLTNGTAYTFTVTATNATGLGSASAVSNSATPKGVQSITFANPGNQSFDAPPVLSASSTSGLGVRFTSTSAAVCTVTSAGVVSFVAAGTCVIEADQDGDAAWNAAPTVSQSFAVGAVLPGAPTITAVAAGDREASVAFTTPSNGGVAISQYVVTVNPGGAQVFGAGSPITVTGLTNGQAYTFTVAATNSEGTGPASTASGATTPKAPQQITFSNPGAQTFGTNPSLSASSNSGLPVSFSSATTGVCTVTGFGQLTFVSAGTCSIEASQGGDNAYLPAPMASQSFTVNAVVPGAPTSVVATAGDTQALVAFAAPTNTGGTFLGDYTVTVEPPDVGPTVGASSPIVVTGLTNGQDYTFKVTASNSVGPGPVSLASNSIMPRATQTITFNGPGPQTFGTTPTLTANSDSGLQPTFTSSAPAVCTITAIGQLTFLSAGTCIINADQPGNGSYLPATQVTRSFAVNAILPGAPTMVGASINGTTATVTFTPPASNGGAVITGYTITESIGGTTVSGATSPIAFPGLTAGQTYTFTIRATNLVGSGGASVASNPVTAQVSQTIDFPDPGLLLTGGSATLAASATSGLPVSYSTTTAAVCSVTAGGSLTLLSVGICTIVVNQPGDVTYAAAPPVSRNLSVASGSVTLAPSAGALADGKIGQVYSQVFSAHDGTAPYVFSHSAGTLPSGLTLAGDMLTGTPTVTGAFSFTITVTDTNGVTAAAAYSILVKPSADIVLTPASGALPEAMEEEDYSQTFATSGQVGAANFAVTSGTLPAGLTIAAATGSISGTVADGAAGNYTFTITVTDADNNVTSGTYSLAVLARDVRAEDVSVTVPAGSTPVPVNLTAGATGGPFEEALLVSVEPPYAGTATITGADIAAIDSDYNDIYLKFIPNPEFTGLAVVGYRLRGALGFSNTATVSYLIAADPTAVAEKISDLSESFMSTRANLLSGAVNTPGLQARRGAASASAPGTVSVSPNGNSITMNFAGSTLAANAAAGAAEGLAQEPVDTSGVNFWIDGTGTLHVRTEGGNDHWGSLGLFSAGADVLVTDDLLVGLALHADWMDDLTSNSRVVGKGILAGPYLSAELVEGVFLDASLFYGRSWNEVSTTLFNGTFETERFLAKASLEGQWMLSDDLVFTPSVNAFYLHESAGAYTVQDALGTTATVSAFTIDQLRLSGGGRLQYRLALENGYVVVPFVSLQLGFVVNNGVGSSFGTVGTGFDLNNGGSWSFGIGVEGSVQAGTLRSISANARLRASF